MAKSAKSLYFCLRSCQIDSLFELLNDHTNTNLIDQIMPIVEQKRRLRSEILELNSTLSHDDKEAQSKSVFQQIEQMEVFRRASVIALFWSLPDEIPTHEVARRWAATKRIALPVVKGREMYFVEYTPQSAMEQGELNVSQPASGRRVEPNEIDLIIVPGVAFDADGCRLGRGKGYYDRFISLCNPSSTSTVGVCMRHQFVDQVPSEEHDKRVEVVVVDE